MWVPVLSIIGSFSGLWKILTIRALAKYINKLFDGFKKVLLPPKINTGVLKQTEKALKYAIGSIIGLGGLLLLLGAVLLAVMFASINEVPMGDTIVHNHVHLQLENTTSLIANYPDSKSDNPSFFTLEVLFPDEAKLEDWLDSKKNGKCEKDHPDRESSQNAPDFDSPAVKPDRHLSTLISRPILKELSACGNPIQKAKLKIVGFSSSSGVLASLKDTCNNAKAEKELKKVEEGQEKSCYERASGNGDQRLSNAFNLCMAELRAENVADMLEEIIDSDETIPADHIEIVPYKWKTYSDMCRQRGFSDTRKEGETECYDMGLGRKNLRAEIRVIELPGCTISSSVNGMPSSEAEAQMPTDSRGKTCGQSASPVPCSRLGSIVESGPKQSTHNELTR